MFFLKNWIGQSCQNRDKPGVKAGRRPPRERRAAAFTPGAVLAVLAAAPAVGMCGLEPQAPPEGAAFPQPEACGMSPQRGEAKDSFAGCSVGKDFFPSKEENSGELGRISV